MISDERHADALRAAAREARSRSWRPFRSTLPALRSGYSGGQPVRMRLVPPRAEPERTGWAWPAAAVAGWVVALLLALVLSGGAHAQTVLIYARADAAQAQRAARLAGAFDAVWLDADLTPGAGWRAEVARRLLSARRVLVLWSTRAAASAEVAAEWRIALAGSAEVVPVLLDDAPLPGELAGRQGVDWRSGSAATCCP